MCSQPPRQIDDSWLIDEIVEVLHLIDYPVAEIGFSGGEPTLLGQRFLELVATAKALLPDTALHVLSNGRSFSDPTFASALGAIKHPDLMIGVPLYSDVSEIHDYVVQANGAYDETVRGILNLKAAGVRTELRVVLHKQTVSGLTELAAFIARNLVFVEQVALMGLEITGFTKINMGELWLDPIDYMEQLTGAVRILDRAKIKTMIFNLQLCLLPENIRRFARQSISDWKQEYIKECTVCSMKEKCGGFFAWNVSNISRGIKAFPGTPIAV
jgi:His-Xaa-Ser system radical SAM maturase HxsC